MSLLQMSVTAGVLILGVILLRTLFLHRLPKRVMLMLWEIAILRLLLPVSIALPLPDLSRLDASCVQSEEYPANAEAADESEIGVAEENQSIAVMVSHQTDRVGFKVFYAAGVLIMAAGSLFFYLRDSRIFREGLPMPEKERSNLISAAAITGKELAQFQKVRLQISDRTATPVTYGVFHPAIVFPKGMCLSREQETGFYLRHELVHIKNHDNLKKLIAHMALCIHWFNPLVWAMYLFFNRDIELLCDEIVIRKNKEIRKDYALALVLMAQQRSFGFTTGLGFGKNSVKERVVAIMKIKKVTIFSIILAVIAVATALTAFVTAAEKEGSSDMAYEVSEVTDREKEEIQALNELMKRNKEQEAEKQRLDGELTEAVEEGNVLSTGIRESLEDLVERYQKFGLSVEFTENDYQLYYNGEPVYFFADNRNRQNPEKYEFSGTVFSKEPNEQNGYTAVVTEYDEKGKVIGLLHLSKEEAEDYRTW